MRITTIIENLNSQNYPNLQTESGLSLYIEYSNGVLLFDTGLSNKMIENAKALNLDLKAVDQCIISHGHNDHTGGLKAFLEINEKAPVYIHKRAFESHYGKLAFIKKDVSVSPDLLEEFSERIHLIEQDTKINEQVQIFCDIKQKNPLYPSNSKLYKGEKSDLVQDDFQHEIVATIEDGGKMAVITGCSHNGVRNMLLTVQERLPNKPIDALLGGFHLMSIPFIKSSMAGTEEDVKAIARDLQTFSLGKIYTMHCTGTRAFKHLDSVLGDQLEYLATGDSVNI